MLLRTIERKHIQYSQPFATEQTLRFLSLKTHYSPSPPIKIISISTWKHLHHDGNYFVGLIKNMYLRTYKLRWRTKLIEIFVICWSTVRLIGQRVFAALKCVLACDSDLWMKYDEKCWTRKFLLRTDLETITPRRRRPPLMTRFEVKINFVTIKNSLSFPPLD